MLMRPASRLAKFEHLSTLCLSTTLPPPITQPHFSYMPPKRKTGASSKAKGKRKAEEIEPEVAEVPQVVKAPSPVPEPAPIPVETGSTPKDRVPTPPPRDSSPSDGEKAGASDGMDIDAGAGAAASETPEEAAGPSMTMEDRQAKMQQLRAKMVSKIAFIPFQG